MQTYELPPKTKSSRSGWQMAAATKLGPGPPSYSSLTRTTMSALLSITSSLKALHPSTKAFRCAVPFFRPLATAHEPTIFAPATGRGKTAISILRISGPDSLHVWERMTKPSRSTRPEQGERATVRPPTPRRATLRRIVHPETREVLDEAIVLFFPGEHDSYRLPPLADIPHRSASSALTSQPTLELHLHGSPALMALMLNLLPTLSPSFRIAEPGSCAGARRRLG